MFAIQYNERVTKFLVNFLLLLVSTLHCRVYLYCLTDTAGLYVHIYVHIA